MRVRQLLTSRLTAGITALLLIGCLGLPVPTWAEQFFLYAGSYTAGTSKGIYAWRFDSRDGSLIPLGLEAATPQPAYVSISKDQKFLYAVNWEEQGGVSAFRIDSATGSLTLLNRVSADGSRPNQVVLHPNGRIAVAVNYTTGNVVAYKVRPDGTLTEAFWQDQHTGQPPSPQQPGPKAHGVLFSPDGRFMYIADLGLDRVYAYRVDARQGVITSGQPPYATTHAGAGPRRMQMTSSGKFLYVNHETDSEVSVFAVNGVGLKELQTISTLPPGFTATNTTAEILISPDDRFLYVSNRGHDSIAVFRINATTGELALQENVPAGGHTPRNIRLDPTGHYLLSANEASGTITVFRINKPTGQLSQVESTAVIDTPGSLCFVRIDGKL
jgi:6-phosphogluconolactonase